MTLLDALLALVLSWFLPRQEAQPLPRARARWRE
jgi:hypothetical protein